MKKLLVIMFSIVLFGQTSFAQEFSCPTNYELTSGASRFFSKVSGSNYFHKTALEKYLEKQIARKFQGKIDVKIDSFSTKDLKNGKFRGIKATGENVVIDSVKISKITLGSLCEYNHFGKNDEQNYKFFTDFPALVRLEFDTENLNLLTQTTDYKKMLKNINNNLRGMLRVENLRFEVAEGKLWYNFAYSSPFLPNIRTFKVGTSLAKVNGKISVIEPQNQSQSAILSILNMVNALNFVNPLDFSAKLLENKNMDTEVKDVYVSDDKLILEAYINIRK